jgi:PAS domain S-box-containing protein
VPCAISPPKGKLRALVDQLPISDRLSVRPIILLSFLAAAAPTLVLFALVNRAAGLWYSPMVHVVLGCSTAIVNSVIAAWLAAESRRARHPALASLSIGFMGLAALNAASSVLRDSVHLVTARTALMLWMALFCAVTVVLFSWQGARHSSRRWIERGPWFQAALALLFVAVAATFFLLDGPIFHTPAYARGIQTATYTLLGGFTSAILLFSVRLFLRKRNTVILFFSLGLYLYVLAVLGQTVGPAWTAPWWYGEALSLISVFAMAFGVLEASRLQHRLELVETLSAQSLELRKSHADLTRSEAQYRSLVDNAPCGIFRLNAFEEFEAANPALLETLAFESTEQLTKLGSFAALFRDKQEFQSVMEELQGTGSAQGEVLLTRRDGSQVKVRLACRKIVSPSSETFCYEGVAEDLSAQSSLEDQLRQSQKMEAVGRLAGGVAHDFNNLLTIISGYIRMLMDTFSSSDPRRNDADRIKNAADRATALTRQLLAFSRKQVLMPATMDLNVVVADMSKILPRLIGEDIDLAFVPGTQLASIYADRGQLEQVLLNLIVNSRDAMPEGGKITIETRNEGLDEKYTRRRRGIVPGEYVMLAVTDTGCGMDQATQARMFEPFFTTKEEGKGTGLGLATVYGIVKQSGGHISVYSEPERGTTFKVYFPATSTVRESEQPGTSHNRLPRAETILVIEDENDLRHMIVRALGRRGYSVLQAGSGEEAIEMVQKNGQTVDILLTDIVMPGMRGTEAAQRIQALVPNLKVLYMSGYTDNALFHQNLLDARSVFIQKPFTLDVLEDKVRQALRAKIKQQAMAVQ